MSHLFIEPGPCNDISQNPQSLNLLARKQKTKDACRLVSMVSHTHIGQIAGLATRPTDTRASRKRLPIQRVQSCLHFISIKSSVLVFLVASYKPEHLPSARVTVLEHGVANRLAERRYYSSRSSPKYNQQHDADKSIQMAFTSI